MIIMSSVSNQSFFVKVYFYFSLFELLFLSIMQKHASRLHCVSTHAVRVFS